MFEILYNAGYMRISSLRTSLETPDTATMFSLASTKDGLIVQQGIPSHCRRTSSQHLCDTSEIPSLRTSLETSGTATMFSLAPINTLRYIRDTELKDFFRDFGYRYDVFARINPETL